MSHRVLRKDVECDEKVLENVLEKDVDWVRKCINFRWKVKVLKGDHKQHGRVQA